MKAAVRSKYGSADVLSIQEVEKPEPKENEILVKVYATTVNRSDHHALTGLPLFMRLATGIFKPKISITGSDFAGRVEVAGKKVTSFKPGDRVMGFIDMGLKSHAQYLALPESKAIIAPATATYEETAACIEGAFYALSAINRMKPFAGQNALVIGGTGAIGSSFIQFLKHYGVSTTAVCAGEHGELVKSLGAHRIIDYKTQDFTKDTYRYDIVFDAVGNNSFVKCRHLLKKKGMYSSTGGFENIFWLFMTPILGGKKVIFAMPNNVNACLAFIRDLVENGKFKPVVDRKYPLEKIAEAYTYVESGQKIGNVIISMEG
jgi:NADPH:quinone reductase-like Zn-dependent oxidoreductase